MKSIMKRAIILLIISGIWTIPGPWGSLNAAEDPFSAANILRIEEPRSAPECALEDVQGKRVKLEDFRGKVVLLDFWATWCHHCKGELPSLVKLYNEFKNSGFVVLAIDRREKKKIVQKYLEKKKLPFPVLLDTDGKVGNHYKVLALPDHFIIDRQGELIGRALGGRDWASVETRNLIRFLVEQNKKK
jgi:peroxiredoxin